MTKIVAFEQCLWYEVLAFFQYIIMTHLSGKLALSWKDKTFILSVKAGKIIQALLYTPKQEPQKIDSPSSVIAQLTQSLFENRSIRLGWAPQEFTQETDIIIDFDKCIPEVIQSVDFSALGPEFIQSLPEHGAFEISVNPEDTRPIQEKVASLPEPLKKNIIEKPVPVFDILSYCASWKKKEWAGFMTALWKGHIRFSLPEKEKYAKVHAPNLVSFYETALETIYNYLYKELQSFSKMLSKEIYGSMQEQHPDILPSLPDNTEVHTFFWNTLSNILVQRMITLEQFGEIVDDWILRHLLATQNILGKHHYTTLVEILHTLRSQKTSRQ